MTFTVFPLQATILSECSSYDGAVPEDGLKLVIEQTRRSNKVTREVAPSEVVDLSFLRDAQAELGIKAR